MLYRKKLYLLLYFLCSSYSASGDTVDENRKILTDISHEKEFKMKIEWVKKVYSDGGHNGFPGLACYRGKYFLAFRSGNGHVSDKAEQIIMSSDNGKDWNILQRQYFRGPDGKTADYRDSHFLVYENRLLLLSFCTPVSDGKRGETYSQVQILDDSMKKFSEPNIILKGHVLWKPYISGNHLYGATY